MRGRRPGIRQYFPAPFVGVVTLLVVLIFLTPNLTSLGRPAAGSLETQAYLVVDRVSGSNVTHLYIKSLANARYQSVVLQLSDTVPWPAPGNLNNLTWSTWRNATDVLVVSDATTADPFLVNVSATYTDSAGVTEQYIGEFEFHLAGGALYTQTLTSGLIDVSPTPVDSLPLFLALLGLPLR